MFLHTDPHNRPTDVYGGTTSLVSDAGPAFLFATAGTTNCCDQTVGLVPPSLTNSVPVIVEGVHCFVPVRNSSLFKFLYARKTVFHHSLPEIPGSARDGKPR